MLHHSRAVGHDARDLPPGSADDERPAAVDVSVLIPILNEGAYLDTTVPAMLEQDFEGRIEFLFMDGGSSDDSRAIIERFAAGDRRIRLLENPARRTPNGLNIGLSQAAGEFAARMDAHTVYPACYVHDGVQRLRRGDVASVSGPQLAVGDGIWSQRIALALSTKLGTGGARFRHQQSAELEVDSGFTGIWSTDSLRAHGGWDEGWPNDQDFELAARIRREGGRIVCLPSMAAGYIPRASLKALGRQYARYGHYRVKTARRHPHSFRRSQALAPALALATTAALAAPGALRRAARGALAAYGASLLAATVPALRRARFADVVWLPLVLATMHITYGFGFLAGCARFGPPLAGLLAPARRRARRR
jgi:succinoglycan biosynthesis protein ExoA